MWAYTSGLGNGVHRMDCIGIPQHILSYWRNKGRSNRPLGYWDRGFQSRSKHGCLLASSCVLLCGYNPCNELITRPGGPTEYRNWLIIWYVNLTWNRPQGLVCMSWWWWWWWYVLHAIYGDRSNKGNSCSIQRTLCIIFSLSEAKSEIMGV